MGSKVSYPIDVTQLINNLLGLLSQRRCFLVVNNLETLLDNNRNWQDENYQRFFSCWQQQGTNSTLLITTQDKPKSFQGSKQWYPLGGMKLAEGVSLLNKLAVQGTIEELEAFVKYVNGHPLTIKLVAGYLSEYCDRQLSQVETLGLEQFELAYQEAKGSHRNKEGARLSWIIQQHLARLNVEQQVFLTNLSVYRLPFNWEAASYMWMETEEKPFVIQKKLQEFCNRSLLIKTKDGKFQFESLVQKFILQQTHNLTDAHKKVIEYYKANLKDESSWQVLEDVAEHLEVVYHYYELENFLLACEFFDICFEFLDLQGYYSSTIAICESLVNKWKSNLKSEHEIAFAHLNNKLGNAYFRLSKYDTAINCYNDLLEFSKTKNNVISIAHAFNNLGNVYTYYLSDYQTAIDCLKQCLNITQSFANLPSDEVKEYQYIRANCLNNLANIHNILEKYKIAIDFSNESLKITEGKKEQYFLKTYAHSLNILGNAYTDTEKYNKAIKHYQKHLEIVQQIKDVSEEARCFNNLAKVYIALKEYSIAEKYFNESLNIKVKIGDRNGEATSLYNLGNMFHSMQDYLKAINNFKKSSEIANSIKNLITEAHSLFNLGCCYDEIEKKSQAVAAFKKAMNLYEIIGFNNNVKQCEQIIKEFSH